MALIKELELSSGVKLNYWKILDVSCSFSALDKTIVNIKIVGYLDKDARLAEKSYLTEYIFQDIEVNIDEDKLLSICYSAVKQTAEFSDAEDDL